MLRKLLACVAMLAVVVVAVAAQGPPRQVPSGQAETNDLNLRAYVELLRSDIRGQKIAIITELMEFSEAEDAAFWPIYREFDLELTRLNDERVGLIQEYAENYSKVTDAIADKMALRALDLEARRTTLKAKYYERLKSALSATTAARFLQVEHQLLTIIDLQIAAALPVLK